MSPHASAANSHPSVASASRLRSALRGAAAPVLTVHGMRGDLVPVANVAHLQSRLQGAAAVKTVLLQGRNHFLPWNSETEVRQALQQAMEFVC